MVIIITAILLSVFHLFTFNYSLFSGKSVLYPDYPNREQFAKYQKIFHALKQELPSYGIVGYITDDKIKAFDVDAKYFVTQYMLSPLVVVYSTDHKYVVGNFYNRIKPEIYKKYNLTLVKDFGDGIILFSKNNIKRKAK